MFLLGLAVGFVGTLLLQIVGMATWWYRLVKRAGERPLEALQRDFADVRRSIRRDP